MKPTLALAPLLILTVLVGGCASSGSGDPQRDAAISTMDRTDALRQAVQASKVQVGESLNAMEALPAAGSKLRNVYGDYKSELREMEKSADRVSKLRREMVQQAASYQKNWFGDTETLDSDTLRAAARERLDTVRRNFDAVEPLYQDVADGYADYIAQLREVRTYLSNDLTTPAVQAVTPTFEKARQNAGSLRTAMDQFIISLRSLSESLAPETSGSVGGPAAQ